MDKQQIKLAKEKLNYLSKLSNRRLLSLFNSSYSVNRSIFPNPRHSYLWNLFKELQFLIPETLYELTKEELSILGMLKVAYDRENKKRHQPAGVTA